MKTTKKMVDAGTKTDTLWSLVEDLLATEATRRMRPKAEARTYEQEVAARDEAERIALVIADVIGAGFTSAGVTFLTLAHPALEAAATEEKPMAVPTVFAAVVPGKSITVFGFHNGTAFRKRFAIGDQGTHGSYNLIYTGKITTITEKRIFIEKSDIGSRSRKSMPLRAFAERHYHFDLQGIAEHNRETSMHI